MLILWEENRIVMKKTLACLVLAAAMCLAAAAQIRFTPIPQVTLPDNIHFYMDPSSGFDGRFSFMKPTWWIFPDGPCDTAQAEALVDALGLNGPLKDYVYMVAVIGPLNGKSYDKEKDFAAYEAMFNRIRVFTNLKIVGIGSGATFVNEAIAPVAGEVADIFCFGGKAPKKITGKSTVPAYLAGKDAAKAAKAYISRNKAVQTEKGKTFNEYTNADEPLLKVIVNTAKDLSLAETFADAWDRLLSRNYRCSNLGHTGYMGGALGQYGDYELEPYLMWERLGTERIKVEQSLFNYNHSEHPYLWYEYVPACLKDAAPGSVPLVILLHGHNNDPRTQAETSGFVELGASEGFFVAELEWQGKPGYEYMDDNGIEAVVRELLRKYPQLDPSRVYAEGLSAGGFSATALGVGKSHLFAAVGAHSGGVYAKGFNLGFPFANPEMLWSEARQKSGKICTPFFSICGTADDAVPFNVPDAPNGTMITDSWRLYQLLDGLTVSGPTDLEKYPVFGLKLQNRRRIETNKHHAMEVGDILDEAGRPLIRVVAVENFGHWNFVPGAREMWEFFKLWRRDPETLQSVYHGEAAAVAASPYESGYYIDALGGDHPYIITSSDEPHTHADLNERLVKFKAPLRIKATRSAWGGPKPAINRSSFGRVEKSDYDYAVKDGDTLRLTVWRQPGFDIPRPIILYSFGGGWQGGHRLSMDNPVFPFLSPMAEMGYVVVSIDYRLGVAKAIERGEFPDVDIATAIAYTEDVDKRHKIVEVCRKACLEAVEDLYDATAFVVEHAAEWGGNPGQIVLCGGSAGACNSIQAEYLRANGDRMAVEHLPDGFRYGGVIPCAGAIFTGGEPLAWESKPAPVMFFHGSSDPIVPYGKGDDFMGPEAIIPSLPDHSPYVFYTMVGSGHEASGIPTGYMNHAIASFIEHYVVRGEKAAMKVEESFADGTTGNSMPFYVLNCNPSPREELIKAIKVMWPEYADEL